MSRDSRGSSSGWGGARAGRAVLALTALILAAGCGRNGGDVPAGFAPEGRGGQDNLMTVEVVRPADSQAATVLATVYDRTLSDGYRLYRRSQDTGYVPASDHEAEFAGTWNRGYEVYHVVDRDWRQRGGSSYVARGTAGGRESVLSPLTNWATVPEAPDSHLVAGRFELLCPVDTVRTDSIPLMKWEAVPGAVRYLVRVERSDRHVHFLAFAPEGQTHIRMAPQPGDDPGTVLHQQPLTRSTYYWTAEAIDVSWRVVARTERAIFQVDPLRPVPPCTP